VQKQADTLAAKQILDLEHLDDQLNVLGPVQVNEPPSLTQQRSALTRQKNTLLNEQRQASSLSNPPATWPRRSSAAPQPLDRH